MTITSLTPQHYLHMAFLAGGSYKKPCPVTVTTREESRNRSMAWDRLTSCRCGEDSESWFRVSAGHTTCLGHCHWLTSRQRETTVIHSKHLLYNFLNTFSHTRSSWLRCRTSRTPWRSCSLREGGDRSGDPYIGPGESVKLNTVQLMIELYPYLRVHSPASRLSDPRPLRLGLRALCLWLQLFSSSWHFEQFVLIRSSILAMFLLVRSLQLLGVQVGRKPAADCVEFLLEMFEEQSLCGAHKK